MRKSLAFAACLALAWVISPGPAYAFQQTPTAPAPKASIEANDVNGKERTFDLELTESDVNVASKGKKRRIPGLGSLGVLPKMNFGLELLYSSEAPEDKSVPAAGDTDQDELTILGKVKRRF